MTRAGEEVSRRRGRIELGSEACGLLVGGFDIRFWISGADVTVLAVWYYTVRYDRAARASKNT